MVVPVTVERRGASRYPIAAPVAWDQGQGLTENLSTTGVFLVTTKAVVPGQVLRLALSLPREATPLIAHGVVVRVELHRDGYGVGVRLESLMPVIASER